jgi:NADH-quinone oxidoreductase subunit J
VSALLVVGLLAALVGARGLGPATPGSEGMGLTALGRALFTDYLFPFELTSVLLLAAMVGVLLLARRRTE